MDIKKSLHEIALNCNKALLIGIGGGGDIIQGIPVKNYLKLLGVKEVYLAGVSCEWWPFDTAGPYDYIMAPTVYDVTELKNAEILAPNVARVNKDTRYKDKEIAEGKVSGIFNEDTYVLGVKNGVLNLVNGLNEFIKKEGIDLVVGMDVGSDSFYSGETELTQPKTPMVDFISLSTLTKLTVPAVYALAGYGCDGELEIEDLDRNVSKVMKAGGFLGAYGLTQQDVADMERACEAFPDPVEKWPCVAAKGDFGKKNMKLMDVWGVNVKLMPITAVTMFFDPHVLVNEVAKYCKELTETKSIKDAEEILIKHNVVPETRLPKSLNFLK